MALAPSGAPTFAPARDGQPSASLVCEAACAPDVPCCTERFVHGNGVERGTLLLRADTGGMLAYSPHAHGGPADALPIAVRARTFASDFFSQLDPGKQLVADIQDAPVTGGPLLGSTYTPLACDDDPDALPECGQVRLGNEEVIVLDAQHQPFYTDNTTHLRIGASPDGQFLATPPSSPDEDSPDRQDAALQDYFYRLQAVYSLIHTFHAGHWDPARRWTRSSRRSSTSRA